MRKARPPHVRDTRESRLLLVLLIAIAFALITVDIRGGGGSPAGGYRQGPDAATVLLANAPDFTVGTRMEGSDELGFATGQGDRARRVELLNSKADVKKGDRLVTFGSEADKPFVPGVPVGVVSRVDPSGGN